MASVWSVAKRVEDEARQIACDRYHDLRCVLACSGQTTELRAQEAVGNSEPKRGGQHAAGIGCRGHRSALHRSARLERIAQSFFAAPLLDVDFVMSVKSTAPSPPGSDAVTEILAL